MADQPPERERITAELIWYVPHEGGQAVPRVQLVDQDMPMLVARLTMGQAQKLREQLALAMREEERLRNAREQPTTEVPA